MTTYEGKLNIFMKYLCNKFTEKSNISTSIPQFTDFFNVDAKFW